MGSVGVISSDQAKFLWADCTNPVFKDFLLILKSFTFWQDILHFLLPPQKKTEAKEKGTNAKNHFDIDALFVDLQMLIVKMVHAGLACRQRQGWSARISIVLQMEDLQ